MCPHSQGKPLSALVGAKAGAWPPTVMISGSVPSGFGAGLLRWIAEYEKWAVKTAGIEYRRQCVADWLRPFFVTAEQMADAW